MDDEILCHPSLACLPLTGFLTPTSEVPMPHHHGMVTGYREHLRGRSLTPFRLSEGARLTARLGTPSAGSSFANLSARFGERIENDRISHLANSSLRTYRTGSTHFINFCTANGFSVLNLGSNLSALQLRVLIEFYVDYVRYIRHPPVRGDTVDSYVSHVAEFLIGSGQIETGGASLRSSTTNHLLRSYKKQDEDGNPKRSAVAIPLTYPLLCDAITIANEHFANNTGLRLGVSAALAIGYACSLRCSEYLLSSNETEIAHQVNSSQSFFWWGDQPFNVCLPTAYPDGLPDHFTTFLDKRKAGEGGPKSIARCADAEPDCLTTLFRFLYAYPPTLRKPLLSGYQGQINDHLVTQVLNKLARLHGFQSDRLRVHASVRSGVLTQLEDHDELTKRAVGGWNSTGGMIAYQKVTLRHATKISVDIHDRSLCPINITKLIYNTPTLPTTTTYG